MGYMTTDEYTNDSGFLNVGNGHKVWWHDWGNKQAKHAIIFLHGGPGSGCKDKHKLNFDSTVQRVIFHDQRGCGQSTPFSSTKHNTTQDLVGDIEQLRKHLGLETIMITGGSWGSTLGLMYALTHPNNVTKMLLGGIFLGTKKEINYIYQGGMATHFPEAWQQYIEVVPKEHAHDTVAYYVEKFNQPNSTEYVKRWSLLEGAAMSLDGDYKKDIQQSAEIDEATLALVQLEAHFFINNCFIEDNYILDNARTIAHIPIVLMQGRFDHVCPPETAYALANALGNNCHLHIMPGSHANELVTREVSRAYSFSFLQ